MTLIPSDYVTIVITIPETHADFMREVLGNAGAGKLGDYAFCSFSTKGIGRFMPGEQAQPFFGKKDSLETIVEEKIETICLI